MFDAPYANTVIDAFRAELDRVRKDCPLEFVAVDLAVKAVCAAHPETNAREVRRWLEEAGVV